MSLNTSWRSPLQPVAEYNEQEHNKGFAPGSSTLRGETFRNSSKFCFSTHLKQMLIFAFVRSSLVSYRQVLK